MGCKRLYNLRINRKSIFYTRWQKQKIKHRTWIGERIKSFNQKKYGKSFNFFVSRYSWYYKGLDLAESGKIDEAIENFDFFFKLAQPNIIQNLEFEKGCSIYIKLCDEIGHKCLNSLNFKEALKYFKKILCLNNNDSHALNDIGYTFLRKGKYEKAIDYFNKVLEITGNNDAYSWFHKGLALSRLERYEEAIVAYDKAIDLKKQASQDCSEEIREKIAVFDYLRMSKKALKSFDEVISILYKSGHSFSSEKNYIEALKAFSTVAGICDRSLEIHPNDAKAWYNK